MRSALCALLLIAAPGPGIASWLNPAPTDGDLERIVRSAYSAASAYARANGNYFARDGEFAGLRDAIAERAYQQLLPAVDHLPVSHQRKWLYYKLFPNVAFDIYPDQVDFMQFLPVSPTETLIREISYALPDDRREMKAARYLNWRINRRVNAEDTVLIARVQQGMASERFTVGPLSEDEVCLRSFCRKMRQLIPEARLPHPPASGWSQRIPVAPVQ